MLPERESFIKNIAREKKVKKNVARKEKCWKNFARKERFERMLPEKKCLEGFEGRRIARKHSPMLFVVRLAMPISCRATTGYQSMIMVAL